MCQTLQSLYTFSFPGTLKATWGGTEKNFFSKNKTYCFRKLVVVVTQCMHTSAVTLLKDVEILI